MITRRWAGGVALALLAGCGKSDFAEARKQVERYNAHVAEAYRRGDVRLIDPVVGDTEGKKITGLIGVRSDFGLTLDSTLLALDITGVERESDRMEVRTRERWSYRDLRIGSGEQVGEASTDEYAMVYFFVRTNQNWVVDELRFTSEPQIGRKTPTWLGSNSPTRIQGHGAP